MEFTTAKKKKSKLINFTFQTYVAALLKYNKDFKKMLNFILNWFFYSSIILKKKDTTEKNPKYKVSIKLIPNLERSLCIFNFILYPNNWLVT